MFALVVIVLAQTPTGVALDVLRPHFRGGAETTLLSVAAFASVHTTIGGMRFQFELPFAHIDSPVTGAGSTFGNPYIGIELGDTTGLGWTAGVRLPLESELDAAGVLGIFADVSRVGAFRDHTLTVEGTARYRVHNANGFTFSAAGGPAVWVATGGGGGETELVLYHELSAGYQDGDVWLAAGFSGWTWITENRGGVGERTAQQVNASIGVARGHVRPTLYLTLPLDQLSNFMLGYVLGAGVAVDLAK